MDKIQELGNQAYQFVMEHYNSPFFWLILFGVLLIVAFLAIRDLGDK